MIDDEWSQFLLSQSSGDNSQFNEKYEPTIIENDITEDTSDDNIPECEELYISTTTKVLYLNQAIDIQNIFWEIPIIDYWKPEEGVIKKQIKIVSNTKEDYEKYNEKLTNLKYYNEVIIKQIDNPQARRVKFKDERKITIGVSKKDIMTCRGKVKNAFYNCFALVMRFKYNDKFNEIHVKVFNTGKMEIPGVLNNDILIIIKKMVLEMLSNYTNSSLEFIQHDEENNVLINSNFNCGYYINRDKLYSILRSSKYNIDTSYDPCSYPGVKCKFYFNKDSGFNSDLQNGQILNEDRNMKMSELDDAKKYTEISFMIFRTGSCLIVGNCTEEVLRYVYSFIKNILYNEYRNINVKNMHTEQKTKKEKIRKKTIQLTSEYYNQLFA
jgi:hypothetical protein